MALKKRSALHAIVYDRYGSKKGLLRYLFYKILWIFGAFRPNKSIDFSQVKRLIFVCSGNICRSPLAEAYARHLGANAFSCGLHCTNNHPADPRAEAYARAAGLDLNNHQTQHIHNFEFQSGDLIIGMEPKHLRELNRITLNGADTVLAGAFCESPTPYLHDPFNCSAEYFRLCEERVLDSVRGLLGR